MFGRRHRRHSEIRELLGMVLDNQTYIVGQVNRLIGMGLTEARRDIAMAQAQERLQREIDELKTAVNNYTTQAGQQTADAIAAARAAWEQNNEQAFNDAADQLDAIAQTLQKENPAEVEDGTFEPSGNA